MATESAEPAQTGTATGSIGTLKLFGIVYLGACFGMTVNARILMGSFGEMFSEAVVALVIVLGGALIPSAVVVALLLKAGVAGTSSAEAAAAQASVDGDDGED